MTGKWPEGISDGLTLICSDCGERPRFDYCVTDEFWERFIEDANQRGVICLPCLDRRCAGIGLGEALLEVQWTGIDHTVVLKPTRVIQYIRLYREPPLLMSDRSIG